MCATSGQTCRYLAVVAKRIEGPEVKRGVRVALLRHFQGPRGSGILQLSSGAIEGKSQTRQTRLSRVVCLRGSNDYRPLVNSEILISKLIAKISTLAIEATFRPFSSWLMKIFPKPEISARYAWFHPRFVRSSRILLPSLMLMSIATSSSSGYPEG